jgi:hypothetical protein
MSNLVQHRDKNNLSCHVNEVNVPALTNDIGKTLFQQGRIVARFR